MTGCTPTRDTGKANRFVYGLMRSDVPPKTAVYGLGIPWKVIWHFERIAEMLSIARDADQTVFK
eukprot:5200340-Pleurochrysis_carterae.AAC.1